MRYIVRRASSLSRRQIAANVPDVFHVVNDIETNESNPTQPR